MKTAKARALDIVREVLGNGFSAETFEVMSRDKSEVGSFIRKWIVAVEAGVEADRKEQQASRAPS